MLVKLIEWIINFFELVLKLIALPVTILVFLFVLIYCKVQVSRDALIINSFSVPKQFEEAGLTPDVVANRIGNTMEEINEDAHAQIEKNEVISARDVGSIPDVEVPGTKLGLRTLTEIARAIPGAHKAEQVVGDIVVAPTGGSSSVKPQITVTIFLKDKYGSPPIKFVPKANDIDPLTREIAEKIWEQVKPFVLASYQYERHNPDEALKLARRIVAEKPKDNPQVAPAYALICKILSDKAVSEERKGNSGGAEKLYKEAFENFSKSIELNSKSAFPYVVWGNRLEAQSRNLENQGSHLAAEKEYDEAIEQYRTAIGIEPKSPAPFNNWGNALRYKNKFKEADAKYQKAIEVDSKFVPAYNNRGLLAYRQDNYNQAIEQYQKANNIDPRRTNHKWWGKTLFADKQYEEAIAQYQTAVELEPKAVNGYIGWGDALAAEKKYDKAIEQYRKAIEICPTNAEAYKGWSNALRDQGERKAADEKSAKAQKFAKADECD